MSGWIWVVFVVLFLVGMAWAVAGE